MLTSPIMSLAIRPFQEGDIEFAVAQATRECWDCPASMFRAFIAHDPEGCFIAEAEGRRVGMITTTRYARSAWIGNLIVTPDDRRRGVGAAMMRHAMGVLEARGINTIRLEADPMGVGIYKRLGFVEQFESPRFCKQPLLNAAPSPAEHLRTTDFEAIRAFDLDCFGDDRGRFLRELVKIGHAAYCVKSKEGIDGFAMALPASEGVRFGPCAARSKEVAGQLLDALMGEFPDKAIITAVPGSNKMAVRLLESRGFVRNTACLRMRRGRHGAESSADSLYALANGATG